MLLSIAATVVISAILGKAASKAIHDVIEISIRKH